MEAGRVAEIYAGEYGTGYLVASGLVLTARHVVAEPRSIDVRFLDSDDVYQGQVAWESAEHDAALIRVSGPRRADFDVVRWGRLIGTARGVPWEATGFPLSQKLPDRRRAVERLHGELDPVTGAPHHVQLELAGTIPDLSSPWRGFSGAAVTSYELVTALVTMAMPAYGHRRLIAVPVERFFADPTFCRVMDEAGGPERILEPVELAPVLAVPPRIGRPASGLSPATLLRPDTEAVPFHGRGEDLRRLTEWCHGSGLGLRLLISPAGYGKTRLARRLAQILQEEGWVTGSLAPAVDVSRMGDRLAGLRAPVLLVADYAETRQSQIKSLIHVAAEHQGTEPLRILLIARTSGEWWDQMSAGSPREVRDLLRNAPVDVVAPFDASDRARIFADAVDGLSKRIPESVPGAVRVPDLSADHFGSPLSIAMEALAALLSPGRSLATASAEDIILDHERPYWSAAAREYGLTLDPEDQRSAVAVAALCGAATEAEAFALLGRLPGLRDDSDDGHGRRRRAARWLRDLYPALAAGTRSAAMYWGSLQPDLLAECLVASVARDDDSLLSRALAEPSADQARRALSVLCRATLHRPETSALLVNLIAGRPDLARHGIAIAPQVENPAPLLAALDKFAAAIPRQPESLGLLWELAGAYPARSLLLSSLKYQIYAAISEIQIAAGALTTTADLESFAVAIANLSREQAATERHYEALRGMQLAAWHYEKLAEEHPALFLPGLAGILTELAEQMAQVGNSGNAAAAIHRALSISERLDTEDHHTHGPLLASTLNRFATLFPKSRTGEALAAIRRAVSIYEERAGEGIDMKRALGSALNTLTATCVAAGQADEALAAARRAVSIYESLPEIEDPDSSPSGYASALYNLMAMLAIAKKFDEALAAGVRMIPVWTRLVKSSLTAESSLARFGPGFLNVLSLIGFLQLEQGEPRLAAVSLSTAITLGRRTPGDTSSVCYQAALNLRTAYQLAPEAVAEVWEHTSGQQLPSWIHDQAGELGEETWYRQEAQAGDITAICHLARMCEAEDNLEGAGTWWRKAAEAGDIGAMTRLGSCLFRYGKTEQAEFWWRSAAAKGGDTEAMAALGMLLMMRRELSEAEAWTHMAADFGSVMAMNTLGTVVFLQGRPDEAEAWWRKASGLGDANATRNLRGLLQAKREAGEEGLTEIREVRWYP